MSFWRSLLRPERPGEGLTEAKTAETSSEEQGRVERDDPFAWVTRVVENTADSRQSSRLALIDLDLIDSNPFQPRRTFDNERLVELAASVAEYGVLQPIVVRSLENRYQLIAGERRTKAARLAGLKVIPAIIRDADLDDSALLSLIENLQREDLNIIEEIAAYTRLLAEFDLTQEELALRLGRSQSGIANKLRLQRLPMAVLDNLEAAKLTERHARALLRLPSTELQLAAQEVIMEQGLNVRQTEDWVETQIRKLEEAKAGKPKEEPAPKRVRRFVPKSLLLFFNEFKRVVTTMNDAGIISDYQQEEDEEQYTITIHISKNK